MNIAATTPPQSCPEIDGYRLTELLYVGSRTAVYRAMKMLNQQPVVIKVLQREYPNFSELVQFRNQYTIVKDLPISGILHPLSLEPLGSSYALVMEDWGGIALNEYFKQQQLSLTEVLTIALQLADILHDLGQHRVVHKDIKPANILIQPESKQVKLIDFSIASLLPKESQEIQSANILEGTLAYLAPEQTGRMNRGIDYRTDFYALGVTLYQLLTGKLPFESDDPLELMHCHIAKVPLPVDQVNPEVPGMVGAIVRRLMAKNAEDRYQSALGLKHDLEHCLTQWKAKGKISEFALGQRDLSDRFLISEKLYGREQEVQTLLDAFDRVAHGSSELMLVAGFSGIGKTAVVNEVHKPITQQRGYFIKGKFDQFNRNIPLSAFVQAFRALIGQLLSESDTQLAQWKATILEVLGDNAEVIVELIPELEQIIGKPSPAPELSGTAAQKRFNLLLQKFIRIFATLQHPLVMFLDDLQWADSASLSLIQTLMTESKIECLLLMGAYRDNEVFTAHPLMLTLQLIRKTGSTIHTLTLKPLNLDSLSLLISDTLCAPRSVIKPLAELVMQKTQGNPFFATQFLKALHQDHLIQFAPDAGYWQCDIAKVRNAALTDDIVEFMALQLQKLPASTQELLKLAACIGAQFDLSTLAIISQQSRTEVATILWQALQEGLILPQSEIYKFYIGETTTTPQEVLDVTLTYKFCHDRVQQAAYSLISPDQTSAVHLKIGQLLLKGIPSQEWESHIFEIVNHLNQGMALIEAPQEREQLAYLNQQAGMSAKRSAAFAAAMNYLKTGLSLLTPQQCWQTQYVLTLELHHLAAEVAYLLGDSDQQNQLIETGLKFALTNLDKCQFHTVKILALIAQKREHDAALYGVNVLHDFGIHFPNNPSQLQIGLELLATLRRMVGKSPQYFLQLPPMSNPEKKAACRLLKIMGSAATVSVPNLLPLLIFKLIALNLKYGYSPGNHVMTLGFVFCEKLGQINRGYELGKVAIELCHKNHEKTELPSILFLWHYFISYRKDSVRQSVPALLEAYQLGLEVGDLEYAAYSLMHHFGCAFRSGYNLLDLHQEIIVSREAMQKLNQEKDLLVHGLYCQVVENLITIRDDVYEMQGQFFDETIVEVPFVQFCLNFEKLVLAVLFDHETTASNYLKLTEPFLDYVDGTLAQRAYALYSTLVLLKQYPKQRRSQQKATLKRIQTNRKTLAKLAKSAPMNFSHQHLLLQAEYHRIMGQSRQAEKDYDLAISNARTNGYTQEEGLANELAAKFYLESSKEKVAAVYLQEAYYCYARWGSKAKTNDLETRYPHLLQPILQAATPAPILLEPLATITGPTQSNPSNSGHTFSSNNINQSLDFVTLLQVSQTIASKIDLDDLLQTLTRKMLENSGADHCALILSNQDNQWQVRVTANLTQITLNPVPLAGNSDVPVKLIQYVKNTMEMVVMDDLKTDLPVIGDYLNFHRPKSVLCLPVVNQGTLVGILYLENRATSSVFTSDRILILNFLCTQAAISLENARLYQQAQTYAQQLEESQLQIVQSEKMASLGNLVAGVAHEINNPIGFLNGSINNAKDYVQDLLDYIALYQQHHPNTALPVQEKAEDIDLEFLGEDLPKLLNSMQGATDRLKGISTSLRTFSRADTEHKVSVNLHEGLDSTLLILKYRLKANEFRPAIEVMQDYGNLPVIDCFPGQLNQVLMNILANAIDMFDEIAQGQSFDELKSHPQQITIRTTSNVNQVQIQIGDNGKGMAEEVRVRIFDHLFTTKGVGKGTGLGLAIARQIVVEKHGGSLEVQSEVGKGTEFYIRLPIAG